MQEHEAILNALRRRDGIALAHILRTHLRHKRDEVLQAGFSDAEQGAAELVDEARSLLSLNPAVRSG
jgi:hypothetical protein